MKILLTLLACIHFSMIYSQNWESIVNLNQQNARRIYLDPIDTVLYISGHFRYVYHDGDTIDARGIIKWDGNSFSKLGSFPNTSCNDWNCNPVISVIRYQDDIYASLHNAFPDLGEFRGIAKWNGIEWDSVKAGIRGLVIEQIVYNDELYAIGRFDEAGTHTVNSIAKWDGEDWHKVNFPYTTFNDGGGITINAAIVHEGELYVAGNFWNEEETVRDVAKFDGENWHPVGNGIKGLADDVGDLIFYNNELYVCGSFRKSSGNAGNKIMKLINNEWVDVGGSFDNEYNQVTKMLIYHDKLYVFGIFDSVNNGFPVDNIAVWDGEKWCSLGSQMDGKIVGAEVFNENLIIAGNFDTIDNLIISELAEWTAKDYLYMCNDPVSIIAETTSENTSIIFPNPVKKTGLLHLNINSPIQKASIYIYESSGRLYSYQCLNNNMFIAPDISGVFFVKIKAKNMPPKHFKILVK